MSSFKGLFKNKSTGKDERVWCLDDYFGHHVYGYRPINSAEVLTEEQFKQRYEVMKNDQ